MNKQVTKFSIIEYCDPFGDRKSSKKVFSRTNFQSVLSLEQVQEKIEQYNETIQNDYYRSIEIDSFDKRRKKIVTFEETMFFVK